MYKSEQLAMAAWSVLEVLALRGGRVSSELSLCGR